MPRYKTHLVGGLVSFLLIVPIVLSCFTFKKPEYFVLGLGLSLLGSIFPDIDIQSKMQNLFYAAISIIIPFALFKDAWTIFFIASFLAILVTLLRHRTITHRIWFLICFPLGLAFALTTYAKQLPSPLIMTFCLFFIGGALSHVFLDKTVSKFKRRFK